MTADNSDQVLDALGQRGAVQLLRAYAAIPDKTVRLKVLDLVEATANALKAAAPSEDVGGEPTPAPTDRTSKLRSTGAKRQVG